MGGRRGNHGRKMIMKGEALAVVIDKMPYAPLSKLLKALVADVAHALG
jgi:hypothetical protein